MYCENFSLPCRLPLNMSTIQIRHIFYYTYTPSVGIIESVSGPPRTVVHLMKCAEVSIRSSAVIKIQEWYCRRRIQIDKEVQWPRILLLLDRKFRSDGLYFVLRSLQWVVVFIDFLFHFCSFTYKDKRLVFV